jgi:hypothetical protein
MTQEQFDQAHSPAVESLPHTGDPAMDHLIDEIQHPELQDAFHDLAEKCSECGQALPVTDPQDPS